MGIIKNLISRLWPTGALFVSGLVLIIYIGLGFLYIQQGAQQREFSEQIVKLGTIVFKPLPDTEELDAELEQVNSYLVPMTDTEAIRMLVGIAEKYGVDISPDSGGFSVPSAQVSQTGVGGGTYQVISFSGIVAQGECDNVMAFISDLDSGTTSNTTVLKSLVFTELKVAFSGTEGERRAEFRNVTSAVKAMMIDNSLLEIPHPMRFSGAIATNLMGDDPDTKGEVEGFPDIITTAAEKGYTGNQTPRDGYVLYRHDKITSSNTTQFETVDYPGVTLTTRYYYTCEANGTVRQWDSPNIGRAREYLGSEDTKTELSVVLDVDIYTK